MSVPPKTMYLDPTDENARRLFQRGIEGPLLMLNLLRFREIADYSGFPDLAPPEPISGSAAYDRYVRHTLPFLAASGGSVEFYGTGGHTFVGPPDERWDRVMLIRHPAWKRSSPLPPTLNTSRVSVTERRLWRIRGCFRSSNGSCLDPGDPECRAAQA